MREGSHYFLKDHGQDFKFPKDFGHSLEWKGVAFDKTEHDLVQTISSYKEDQPRQCRLKINSYLGSIGAVHTYVRLDLGYAHSRRKVPDQEGSTNWGMGDTVPEGYEKPLGLGSFEIEVFRRVDDRDIKYDQEQHELMPDHWMYGKMKKNDWTHGFWTEPEAIAAGIAWFEKHFSDGWILVEENYFADHATQNKVYASHDPSVVPNYDKIKEEYVVMLRKHFRHHPDDTKAQARAAVQRLIDGELKAESFEPAYSEIKLEIKEIQEENDRLRQLGRCRFL